MERLLDVGKQQFTSYNFNTSNKLINKSVSKTAISQITLGSIADFTLVQEQSNVGISNVTGDVGTKLAP
jgi:hypothetical protein